MATGVPFVLAISSPRSAMAVSPGFGVPFATLITLYIPVPTAYMILDDVGRTMRRVFGGSRPAPDVGVSRVWRVDAGAIPVATPMETSRAVRVSTLRQPPAAGRARRRRGGAGRDPANQPTE